MMENDNNAHQEVYKCWVPDPGPGDVEILRFAVDEDDILSMDFEVYGTKKRVRITFRHQIAFRYTDEGDRLAMFAREKREEACLVYKVDNSYFLKWYLEESYGMREGWDIVHYCIMTLNYIFDILSLKEPDVEEYESS